MKVSLSSSGTFLILANFNLFEFPAAILEKGLLVSNWFGFRFYYTQLKKRSNPQIVNTFFHH